MKTIYNCFLPFPGFVAINLFGILFVRKEYRGYINKQTINHEAIHTAQMKELGYIGFYLIYFFEWLYRLVFHTKNAYRGISFEKEAYGNQDNLHYLKKRKHYVMWRKLPK